MSGRPDDPSPFDRRNGLIAGGWLRVLSPTEVAVWMVYDNHADRDGLSYPKTETVANLIGHAGDKKVKEAVRTLAKGGLLAIVVPPTGGKSPKVRVLVPGNAPADRAEFEAIVRRAKDTPSRGADPHPDSGCEDTPIRGADTPIQGATTPRFGVPAHPDSGCDDTPIRGFAHKNEQTNEQTNEQEARPAPATATRLTDPAQPKPPTASTTAGGGRRSKPTPEPLPPIPPELDTQEFREVWADWQHSRANRKPPKPLTALAAKHQFRDLVPLGPARAVEVVRRSIAAGWQGIVIPENDPKPAAAGRSSASANDGVSGRWAAARQPAPTNPTPTRST